MITVYFVYLCTTMELQVKSVFYVEKHGVLLRKQCKCIEIEKNQDTLTHLPDYASIGETADR